METHIYSIRDLAFESRRVFVRVDFNVPLAGGEIADDARIMAALPTLRHLIDKGARLIIGSHLGRPGGQPNAKLSLLPIAIRLAELLEVDVRLPETPVGDGPRKLVHDLRDGQILLLENLRFHPGEVANDESFARELASYCDIYVNDAFGVAHRAHASVEALPRMISTRAAGFLMEKEITSLGQLVSKPERPFVAVLGGSKVSSKIGAFDSLMMKADSILVGGAMAYTFLSAEGNPVGASMTERPKMPVARRALLKARSRGVQVCLPTDHVIVREVDEAAPRDICGNDDFPSGAIGVDIGPETAARYSAIIQSAKTVFWNGPMGIFEIAPFSKGTRAIAEAVAATDATTVVGGGDSLLALKETGTFDKVDHASTGGGASLAMIEEKIMPAIEALKIPLLDL